MRKRMREELCSAEGEVTTARRRAARADALVQKAGRTAERLRVRREQNGFAASLRMVFEGTPRG